jgi:hypothetical protein
MSRLAIIHEAANGPDAEGRQRCVLCGKILAGKPEDGVDRLIFTGGKDRPSEMHFWAGGSVTELDGDMYAGDDTGSPVPHIRCIELPPA